MYASQLPSLFVSEMAVVVLISANCRISKNSADPCGSASYPGLLEMLRSRGMGDPNEYPVKVSLRGFDL